MAAVRTQVEASRQGSDHFGSRSLDGCPRLPLLELSHTVPIAATRFDLDSIEQKEPLAIGDQASSQGVWSEQTATTVIVCPSGMLPWPVVQPVGATATPRGSGKLTRS